MSRVLHKQRVKLVQSICHVAVSKEGAGVDKALAARCYLLTSRAHAMLVRRSEASPRMTSEAECDNQPHRAAGQEIDADGTQLLIDELPATITAATITAAIATTITATAPTLTAIVTARRRRWRRRSPGLTTTAPIGATAVWAAAPRAGTRTNDRRPNERRCKEEAKCFSFGGNGGGSKRKSCRGHNGYPAESQHHDTSLCFCLAVNPHL
jgi:hypothetical protein